MTRKKNPKNQPRLIWEIPLPQAPESALIEARVYINRLDTFLTNDAENLPQIHGRLHITCMDPITASFNTTTPDNYRQDCNTLLSAGWEITDTMDLEGADNPIIQTWEHPARDYIVSVHVYPPCQPYTD